MSADLKPYPAMKDSGVEWLGEVPKHWTTERLKSSMHNIVEQTTERRAADLYVALEHVESWTGRLRHAGLDVSFDSQVKCFRSGDVLFGKLRPYLAKVTRPTSDGICVGEFLVLRPRHSNATAPYMEQLLRSKPIIDAVNSSTFGAKMPRADWQFMGGMAIALPPLPEQAAIVRFLDYADRRIRRYIRAQQQLIALLEEQKQALIHQAVTGQIDVRTGKPYQAYKPSGVEWLGDVPEHWEIKRLKSMVPRIDRCVSPQADNYLAMALLGACLRRVVSTGACWETEHKCLAAGFEFDSVLAVAVGDVLVSHQVVRPIRKGSVGRVSSLNYKLILSDKTFVSSGQSECRCRLHGDGDEQSLLPSASVELFISGARTRIGEQPSTVIIEPSFVVPSTDEQHDIVGYLEDRPTN